MTIGLSTLFLLQNNKSFEDMVREIARKRSDDASPDYWELVDEDIHALNKDRVKKILRLKEQGLYFTLHCPYFVAAKISHPDAAIRKPAVKRMKNSIEFAAAVDAQSWVLHPGCVHEGFEKDESLRANHESIVTLSDYAKSNGVKAVLENMSPKPWNTLKSLMSTPDEFQRFFKSAKPGMMINFDVGHAHLGDLEFGFIEKLSDRFLAIHCHDNNGVTDDHLNIGEGNIEWDEVCRNLSAKRFRGIYTVEAVKKPRNSIKKLKRIIR